jgi:putative ABC transport system permease protein
MTRREFRWLLLKQALLQKKGKALLILLALTIGASVVAALLNVQIDLRSRMNRELRDYGPNIVLLPKQEGAFLSDDYLVAIRHSPISERIIASTSELFVPVSIQDLRVMLVGVEMNGYRKIYPSFDWQMRSASSDAIFLGKRLAERLRADKKQTVGVKILNEDVTLPIGGVIESGEAEDDQAFVSLHLAQKLSHREHQMQAVLLSVLGDIPQVENDLREAVGNQKGMTYQIIRKIATAETLILDKISRLMGLVVVLIFVILCFCIHTTVTAILLSRQQEIALLRVLGARRKQITEALTSELLVLGVIGGILGFGVGMLMAQILGRVLFQSWIVPSIIVFVITLFFSLFLMVTSSFLPISRAVNRQAALALKEA